MHKLTELKAGEFIDLQEYSKALLVPDENAEEYIKQFYFILNGALPKTETELTQIIEEFGKQIEEIKGQFEFVFNPPDLPSSIDEKPPTIGDEYRKEFTGFYGAYVELVYLLCAVFKYKPEEALELRCQDFLFWANYLLHKKYVESIK